MKTLTMFLCVSLLAAVQPAPGQGKWSTPPPDARGDNPVDNLYLKAAKAQHDKNYKLAIECWTEALKINPQDETALVNRAGAYADSGDQEKAFADYAEALRLDPKDASAFTYRAELYRTRRINTITKGAPDDPDDTEKAIADYTKALELGISGESQPGKWAQDKARAAEQAHNYELAAACWSAALQLDPKNAAAWFRLAVAHAQVLETDKALADCDKALQGDPGNDDAREFRSQIERQAKAGHDKDMADLTQKIHAEPGSATYTQRAQAWLEMGESEKAADDFRVILWLNTNDLMNGREGARQYLASIYGDEGKWAKAMEICKLAGAGAPVGESEHTRRAWIYKGMGDYAQASIESHKDVEEERKMVQLQLDQKKAEDAAEAADAAQEAQMEADMAAAEHAPPPPRKPAPAPKPPDDEDEYKYSSLCQALIRCGEMDDRAKMYDKALADFTEELKLEPKDTWGMNAKAWFLATCPDAKFRDAANAIKLAQAGGDSDTLAAAYAEAGKWDEAVAEEKRAIEEDTEGIKKATVRETQATAALAAATTPPAIREQKKALWQTQRSIKEDEEEISRFTARLKLYEEKKPCREVKELDVGG